MYICETDGLKKRTRISCVTLSPSLIVLHSLQVGNHIDVITAKWVAQDAGIGAGVDSYFEYLVKGAILLQDKELMSMFLGECLFAVGRGPAAVAGGDEGSNGAQSRLF